ncbi:MAG TPA: FxDxF family PEP-CTERM protein [Rhizobacter sp.]|nr:FxDxF family PEP-CTERM protein [Rhizobacter sp.]
MKFKSLAAALALVASAPAAMAACSETFNLGVMGPPALQLIGNDFSSAQHFEDCYNFTLSGPANSFGFTLEFDGSARRDIDLKGITLSGGSLAQSIFDPTESSFSFSNLLAGTYQFVITGDVTGANGGFLGGGLVGYAGSFLTVASSGGIAAPVPEPQTYALLALGLMAVGWTVRRRNQA